MGCLKGHVGDEEGGCRWIHSAHLMFEERGWNRTNSMERIVKVPLAAAVSGSLQLCKTKNRLSCAANLRRNRAARSVGRAALDPAKCSRNFIPSCSLQEVHLLGFRGCLGRRSGRRGKARLGLDFGRHPPPLTPRFFCPVHALPSFSKPAEVPSHRLPGSSCQLSFHPIPIIKRRN